MTDMINLPPHYTATAYEPIDIVDTNLLGAVIVEAGSEPCS